MRLLFSECVVIVSLLFFLQYNVSGQRQETLGMSFTRHPQPLAAPLGDEVNFECSLNLAADKFAWRHRPLGSDKWQPFFHITNSTGKTSRYVVMFDHESKAGDYRCVAFYGTSGLASDPARLSLAVIHEFSDRNSDTEMRVAEGNTVPISCQTPYSVPEAIVQYYKDDRLVENATITGISKSMVIENSRLSDSGRYHCMANNYITSQSFVSKRRILLTVYPNNHNKTLYFIKQPRTEYRVLKGKNVTLECFGAGWPIPDVYWNKLGSNLPADSFISSTGLNIVNVQPSARGEYDCMWKNSYKIIKSMIILKVDEQPRVLKAPKSSTFSEGGELELSCVVSGQPEPSIEWLINGETLLESKYLEIRRSSLSSTLYISMVEKKHAGIVQCVASNEYGSHSGYNLLRVTPKQHVGGVTESKLEYMIPKEGNKRTRNGPGKRKDNKKKGNAILVPPNKPDVTRLSDTSVMVRWSVPENTGLPIQFFKVQYRENGQKQEKNRTIWMTPNNVISNHVRSFAVTDLKTNHTYRFRIAAVYSNDDNKISPISDKFHLNSISGSGSNKMPVPILNATEALGPEEVLLVWQNPDRNTNIDGFYVYHRASTSAGDYVKTTVEGQNATNITISHLQPDTTYEFKVQSFSVDAASEFSKILSEKTKKVVTEPTISTQSENKQKLLEGTRKSNMYAIIGGVLGGTTLLGGIAALGIAYKRSKHKQPRDASQNQGKPMTNGRVMNGGLADSKINITSNPLAGLDPSEESVQPKSGQQPSMEMASFLNGQNNNTSVLNNSQTPTPSLNLHQEQSLEQPL